MKWSFYQLGMFLFLVIAMWLLEYSSENRAVQSASGEWTVVISSYGTFVAVSLVLTFIYFIFLFEAKKDKSLLHHPIWANMPKVTVIVGVLSVILFIVGGTIGPIMIWIEQWRSLLYVFLVYFLFLLFLFIFSSEHKKERASQHSQKSIHISYIWTLVVFFGLYFLF